MKYSEGGNPHISNFIELMAASGDAGQSKYEGGQAQILQYKQSCEAKKYLRYSRDFEKEPLKPQDQLQMKEKTEEQNESVSIHRFFKYNNKKDCFMLMIGTLGALIAGILIPSISIIMGSVADTFGSKNDIGQMSATIKSTAKWIALIAGSIFFFGYIFFAFWQHLAENISLKLRKLYLNALLKQEIAFFEKTQIEQIPAQMGEVFQTIHRSIGEQYANLLFALFNAIGGCIFAFISGPELAYYLIAYLPVFFLILGTFGILVKNSTGEKLDAIKQMGGVVSEILYAIKVVISFGRESQELEKFYKFSEHANVIGKKYQGRYSFMVAIMKFAIFSFYTFSFYIGSLFVENKRINSANNLPYDSKTVLTVLIALITGFLSLIAALPHIQGIQAAKLAGKTIFNVIDRKPMIDDCLDPISNFTLLKSIDFKNVSFKYPTAAPEQRNVLNNVSFSIKAGESTAIVGPSGSGKSTIVQLIERFYDPVENAIDLKKGSICFDQNDIRTIRLKELRESIGYVPQEPTMIIGTIKENLLFGNKDATDTQIYEALRKANAQFVFDFEMKLDTFIGTSSVVNLSGGQKQRLAIARALLKNPKILILDEATSALDPQSEKEVQDAIEQIENLNSNDQDYQPLTILIIAHRLSSITSAKNLLYLESRDKVQLYEKGTDEYEKAINRLKNFTYAFGKGEEEILEQEKINLIKEQSILEKSLVNSKIQIDEITEINNNIKKQKQKNFLIQKSDQQNIQQENQIKNESTVQEQQQSSNIDEFLDDDQQRISSSQIMKYYNPKWLAIVGIISSIISSIQLPVFGFLLSKMVFLMQNFQSNPDFDNQRNFWIIMFQIMCTGLFIFTFLQKYAFGYGSENLTNKIRIKLFEAILYKDIGWFDDKNRAPGILGNIIQEDISLLNGLTSEVYGVALESLMGLIISSAMCLYFSWQVGLIAIVLSPLMVFGGFFMSSFQWAQGKVDDQYKESNALLSDIIMNYRTIISLGEKNINFILEKYFKLLDKPNQEGIKRAHFSGILYGYSQSVRFIFVGVSFYLASLIIENSEDPNGIRDNVFTAVYIMFVGAIGAGVAVSQMPSITRAQQSAQKIFLIINESSKIDSRSNLNLVQNNQIQQGQIHIKNISFKYPSREKLVLSDLDLTINGNESVALVGHSGSGKSTIASLLLRFYDKQKGKILIDGLEIEKYPVKYIRDQIAIVMQEPLLFNESIKDNIKYGNLDATDLQVLEAAEQANCLDFIQKSEDHFQNKEVKFQIKNEYDQIINNLSQKYPNLIGLKILVNELLIEEIFLVKELLELVNDNGLQQINNNIQVFIENVILKLSKSQTLLTHTWKTLLMDFIWKINTFPFLQSIIQKNEKLLINKNNSSFQNITDYILMNPWKIDQIALEEYFEKFNDCYDDYNRKISNSFCITQDQYKKIEFQQDKNKKDQVQSKYIKNSIISQSLSESQYSIINFLAQYKDQNRINQIYEKILSQLIDVNKINMKRGVLHPGFEKLCGLRGSKLSGGQKQRVAIARALIRNPRILILDEATSALDEKSQEIVQQALERAMKGRTSIVIAHRLSTVKKCDKIIVLHNGKVVEQGTYNSLCQDPDSYFFKLKAGLQVDN